MPRVTSPDPGAATNRIGRFVETAAGGERVRAYIPAPLPPDPPIDLEALMPLYDRAVAAVARLDGLAVILPSAPLFLLMYVRKEALLSSQIEGTQSSLSDLLLFENARAPSVALDDVVDVSNYVAAVEHGLTRLHEGFPLSLRLIREIHAILLKSGRGAAAQPGEFRRSQNWIGGTRPGNALFVPPPPNMLAGCLDAFERFLHSDRPRLPPLIRAGLAHVQFETIHPFLDGNGRLGRLLMTLILCDAGLLRAPILYLSLYLKARRDDYYRLLQEVREAGAWETWLEFFLTGVAETAEQAADTATSLIAMVDDHRRQIAALGRAAPTALRVHETLQARPIVTIRTVADAHAISFPTARHALENLVRLGLVRETTGRRRDRVYAYTDYLAILERGTEPLRA
jgi:Fic family protein